MVTMCRSIVLSGMLLIAAAEVRAETSLEDVASTPHLRRPAALAVQGERLYVANRRSGSVSLVDLPSRQVVGEFVVGKQLEDVAAIPGGERLLAVDSGSDEAIVLQASGDALSVVERLRVSGSPVSVKVAGDGSFCSVASLWARRVTLIDIVASEDEKAGGVELRPRMHIDLPFAPRAQWLSQDGARLVVADSFGGRIAAIDAKAGQLLAVRSFDGHNLRGMTADADERELLVTHQILNESVPTTHERVFWGTVMGNVARSIPLDDLFAATGEESLQESSRVFDLAHWSLHPLGRPGSATGDPGATAVTRSGKTIIALSGVGEVAYRPAPLQSFSRHQVGQRPVAVALDEKEEFAYVANQFDDSISVFDLKRGEVVQTIALGPQPELSEADRGEVMFYDAHFALDGWYSCHSCHTDGHSNGLLNDNFSDDAFGASKRILSLLGVGDTGPWAWSGRQDSLEEQVRKSITITMRDHDGAHATEENVSALTAYMRALTPPPSLREARGEANTGRHARGEKVFHAQGCADCHQPPTYTTPDTYNVGLEDAAGNRRFNPPSLRGVSQRDALFHDNRAASLRDALVRHKHGQADQISPEDLESLLYFLESL